MLAIGPIFDTAFEYGNHFLHSLFLFEGFKDGLSWDEGFVWKLFFGQVFNAAAFEDIWRFNFQFQVGLFLLFENANERRLRIDFIVGEMILDFDVGDVWIVNSESSDCDLFE